MSKKVFITRKIPDLAENMLRNRGYEVDVSTSGEPLSKNELIDKLKGANYDAVLTLLNDKIDTEVMDASPATKIFANYTIGFDNIDVVEAQKRGIFVTNAPGGGADRVAEHTWALILALTCRVVEGDSFVRDGKYSGWDPMLLTGTRITGKTMGIIGAGRIGTEVARIASQGFGMRVAYTDVVRNDKIERLHNATYWPIPEDVLKQADVISLHVPLLPSTFHLINEKHLNTMKKTAYLVNTSRGAVIDENSLVKALKENKIAGAGLDVFEDEPKLAEGLCNLPNVILTPHIASASLDCREDMARIAASNIIQALEGGVPKDNLYKVERLSRGLNTLAFHQ